MGKWLSPAAVIKITRPAEDHGNGERRGDVEHGATNPIYGLIRDV